MNAYRISLAADRDIDDILAYIHSQSEQNATLVAERFAAAFERIAETPGLGTTRDELHNNRLRVLSVSGYLVIFKPDVSTVVIVRVVRSARDLQRVRLPRDEQ